MITSRRILIHRNALAFEAPITAPMIRQTAGPLGNGSHCWNHIFESQAKRTRSGSRWGWMIFPLIQVLAKNKYIKFRRILLQSRIFHTTLLLWWYYLNNLLWKYGYENFEEIRKSSPKFFDNIMNSSDRGWSLQGHDVFWITPVDFSLWSTFGWNCIALGLRSIKKKTEKLKFKNKKIIIHFVN